MKRALVLTLLVVSLGVFAFAGPLTGEWDTDFCLEVQTTGVTTFTSLTSELDVAYEVCGWTFGTYMYFGMSNGFEDIGFTVDGALGAFQFATLVDFDPTGTGAWSQWEGYVDISIAGVELYALFDLTADDEDEGTDNQSGFALGGIGTVGECTLYVEADFGLVSEQSMIYNYGLGTAYAYGFASVGTCDLAWTQLDVIALFPFACVDVKTTVEFTCTNGFEFASFGLANIDLGLSWLQIDALTVKFTTLSKQVSMSLGLITLDTVCITPYISILGDGAQFVFDGISVDALELAYTWNGVTFLATEIFDNYSFKKQCDPTLDDATGLDENEPNEMIGFTVDGDSCCGGSFDAYVYNFFAFDPEGVAEDNTAKIFDWDHTCVGLTYGISSTVTLDASLVVTATGLQEMCFGFEFVW